VEQSGTDQNRTIGAALKQNIKTKTPVIYNILLILQQEFINVKKECNEYIAFKKAIHQNVPYFGIPGGLSTTGKRRNYMEKFIKEEVKKKQGEFFKVLEIGSWLGSSAILWADAIKKYNDGKGLVICVDPWVPYIKPENIGYSKTPLKMEKALKKNRVLPLFLHNIQASRLESIIKPYKGTSEELLPTLRDEEFNFVYVDGSHLYSDVLKDLKRCGRLVSQNGVLGGDDLELQKNEIDVVNAEKQKEKDYIIDTKTNKPFHPGVSIAVGEFFSNRVSNYEGFWIMRKMQGEWRQVEIS